MSWPTPTTTPSVIAEAYEGTGGNPKLQDLHNTWQQQDTQEESQLAPSNNSVAETRGLEADQ